VKSEKLFLVISSLVVFLFLGSVLMFLAFPMERSFAGTFPLIIGSASICTLPAAVLLVWGLKISKPDLASKSQLFKGLIGALVVPPAIFICGFLISFFTMFRGR
jgi:hypothetical protein